MEKITNQWGAVPLPYEYQKNLGENVNAVYRAMQVEVTNNNSMINSLISYYSTEHSSSEAMNIYDQIERWFSTAK